MHYYVTFQIPYSHLHSLTSSRDKATSQQYVSICVICVNYSPRMIPKLPNKDGCCSSLCLFFHGDVVKQCFSLTTLGSVHYYAWYLFSTPILSVLYLVSSILRQSQVKLIVNIRSWQGPISGQTWVKLLNWSNL